MAKFISIYLILLLLLFAITISYFLGEDNKNSLLVGALFLSTALLIIYKQPFSFQDWPILLFLGVLFFSAYINVESFRWSTLLYTGLFFTTFLYYKKTIKLGFLCPYTYTQLLKILIFAYCTVLIIQQMCVLIGAPVFNIINYDASTPFKLNALAPEPSHSARMMLFLMYSYISMKGVFAGRRYTFIEDFKEDRWVWFAFLYPMITMGSGLAFFNLLLFLCYFVNPKHIGEISLSVITFIFILYFIDVPALNRVKAFIPAVLTGNIDQIRAADASASYRIVPTILYFKMIDLFDLKTWVGYGTDYSTNMFIKAMPGATKNSIVGGILPTLFMNYGILTGIAFFVFMKKIIFKTLFSYEFLLWVFTMIMVGLNTQLVWFSFILLFTNHFFKELLEKEV